MVKTQDANGDFTHYRYDAGGLLTAGWANRQGLTLTSTPPDAATVAPTVYYGYDVYGSALSIRTTPVAVVSAQFAGLDAVGDAVEIDEASTVRRSYEFLNGFGRVIESHTVAPDGSGGRLVTQVEFDDVGRVVRASEPFWDASPAQVASGLKRGEWPTVPRFTETSYDASGRVDSTTMQVLINGVQTAVPLSEAQFGLDWSVSKSPATQAYTKVTNDVLGRTVKQEQFPDSLPGSTPITTNYQYAITSSGSTVTVIDDAGEETVFTSDLGGRRIGLTDPNSGVSTYTYNASGQVSQVVSAAGTVSLTYDPLGRMTARSTTDAASNVSSSANWVYSDVEGQLGLLLEESSTTHTPEGPLTTVTEHEYNSENQVESTTVTLPNDPILGDLAGQAYSTTYGYDALGQPAVTGFPAVGGLPAEFALTGRGPSGSALALTIVDHLDQQERQLSTALVTGVSVSPIGQMLARTYGNGVTRGYQWDQKWQQLSALTASFDLDGPGPGLPTTVQHDTFTRDVMGRIVRSENLVADAATGKVTAECFTYNGFNRLTAAWTVAGEGTPGACGTVAPASSADPVSDVTGTAYASLWEYSSAGRIESHIRNVAGVNVASTLLYEDPDEVGSEGVAPAAVTSVETVTAEHEVTLSDGFTSGDYAGDDTSARWVGAWVESDDTGTPQHTTGLVDVAGGQLRLTAALPTGPAPTLTHAIDTTGITDGDLELTLTDWSDSTLADDRLLVEVFADGDPVPVTAQFAGGDGLPAGTGGTPDTVTVDISSLLPSVEVTVHLSVTSTVDEQLTPAPVFLIDTVAVVLTVDEATTTDSFTYDAAGRMLTRDVDGVETTLTWDASSNLTSTTADGVVTIYAYDAGGQRVAQATLAAGGDPGTASAYVAGMELTDPDTSSTSTGDVAGTRFYTFGGATVAVRTATELFLLLGDEQGSAQIMMPLHTDSNGALLPATHADADATERTAYAPYGARRGEDLQDINRGWLGQVEDGGTGLTYLNARYYDPAIGRFLSPDPLMNPGDPRTLDPYRYADNNPVVHKDDTG